MTEPPTGDSPRSTLHAPPRIGIGLDVHALEAGRRLVLGGVRVTPRLLRRAVVKAWHDRVLGLSAEAAFWQLLSLPSLFLALIATLGYVSRWFGGSTVNRTERQIETTLGRALSHQVSDQVIHPMLHEVLHAGRPDIISIGFVLALWAGSSATATFVNTITIAYGMRDLRGAVRSRLLALWLFLGSVLFGVILLPMLVLGPQLLRQSFPDLPVLLVSGYSKAAEAARQEFPLLRKPYQMPELARAVSRLIRDAREPPEGGNLVRLGEERRRRRQDRTS